MKSRISANPSAWFPWRSGICILLFFVITTSGFAQSQSEESRPLRVWKDVQGRELIGELIASDHNWAALRLESQAKIPVPISRFSADDRRFIRSWRKSNPDSPWVDPGAMPPWPRSLGSGPVRVNRAGGENDFAYRSPHFEITSDIDLPVSVVSDIATIFEATRVAALHLPLGLAAEPPIPAWRRHLVRRLETGQENPELLRVQFYSDPGAYTRSGAPAGAGGFYSPMLHCTVLSLNNLGIGKDKGLSPLEYRKNEFILKHEITHHILHRWNHRMPVWFSEGIAEYLAAAPYSQGSYQFVSVDVRMKDYLNKWRFNEDHSRIPIMRTETLMKMTGTEWTARLKSGAPILEYNSAAMLVHYFIHHDAAGNAAHLAGFLDALRRGIPLGEAEKTHLLRRRTFAQLDEDIRLSWQKRGVTLERTVDPFAPE